MISWGKKIGVRKKMKIGKEKIRKITLKKGKRALKMHLFGLLNQKLKTYLSGKKFNLKRGRGGKLSECTIYIPEQRRNKIKASKII